MSSKRAGYIALFTFLTVITGGGFLVFLVFYAVGYILWQLFFDDSIF